MSRTLSDPKYGLISPTVLPIEYGGTAASTPEQAAVNLDMIPTSQLGQPNGVAKSDNAAKLPLDLLLDFVDRVVMIDGPTNISGSVLASYEITNYDYQKTYHLSVIGLGTVVQNEQTINYTPPPSATDGGDGFIVNGKKYLFTISPNGVNQPTIVAPVNNALGVTTDYTFIGSPFGYSGSSQTHSSSDWQIATDSNFLNVVQSVTDNSSYKTTWTVTGMDAGVTLYVRARYKGTLTGYSNWTNPTVFTTKNVYPSVESASIVSPDNTYALFGQSVAMTRDGTIIVMTSPDLYENDVSFGAFYVYEKVNSSWVQQYKGKSLIAADTDYGISVAINDSGDTIIIGARSDRLALGNLSILSGRAHIYKKTGGAWLLEATIKGDAYDTEAQERFGTSVSLDSTGNVALIGAPLGNSGKGYAYIYRRDGTTWAREAKIQPTVATTAFGTAVSLSSDGIYAAISGLPSKAYVFKYATGTWSEQGILTPDVTGTDGFGYSIAINDVGDAVLVGAYSSTLTQSHQGCVYVFTRSTNTWSKQSLIMPPNPISSEFFGSTVDLNSAGDVAIIGAPGYGISVDTYQRGATYVFTESGGSWTMQSKMLASNTYVVGTTSFQSLMQIPVAGTWSGFAAVGPNIYACAYSGDIYKQTNGIGNFARLNQVARQWKAMCSVGNYLYACVTAGSIYRRTNESGDFVNLSQTSKNWTGLAAVGNNVYACVTGGDIYKQTNTAGNFVALGKTTRAWSGMCTDGTYIYLCVAGERIYKLDPTTDELTVVPNCPVKPWVSITAIGQNIYIYSNYEDIYVKKQGTDNVEPTGFWTTAGSNPGPILCLGALGASLYFGINTAGYIYVKTSGTSQFGYDVAINGIGSRAIASLPYQNKDSYAGVGEVRILE